MTLDGILIVITNIHWVVFYLIIEIMFHKLYEAFVLLHACQCTKFFSSHYFGLVKWKEWKIKIRRIFILVLILLF